MGDRYPGQNESRWVFVLIGIGFWVLAFLMLNTHLWFVGVLSLLTGLSMVWPNIFWGREGVARFMTWFNWLRAIFWRW